MGYDHFSGNAQLPNCTPQNGYLTVSTITLFLIELLEAIDRENMKDY